MTERTLRDTWIAFSKAVLPPDAGPSTIRAMELAYYKGASALFGLMHVATEAENEEPTDEEVRSIQQLYEEMETWERLFFGETRQ